MPSLRTLAALSGATALTSMVVGTTATANADANRWMVSADAAAADGGGKQCDPASFMIGNGTMDTKPLQENPATNAAECCAQCAQLSTCGHFVFDSNASICKLKRLPLTHVALDYRPECTAGAPTSATPPAPAPAPTAPAPLQPPPLGFLPHILFFMADDLGEWRAQK